MDMDVILSWVSFNFALGDANSSNFTLCKELVLVVVKLHNHLHDVNLCHFLAVNLNNLSFDKQFLSLVTSCDYGLF